jgi:hypothetical protein
MLHAMDAPMLACEAALAKAKKADAIALLAQTKGRRSLKRSFKGSEAQD